MAEIEIEAATLLAADRLPDPRAAYTLLSRAVREELRRAGAPVEPTAHVREWEARGNEDASAALSGRYEESSLRAARRIIEHMRRGAGSAGAWLDRLSLDTLAEILRREMWC